MVDAHPPKRVPLSPTLRKRDGARRRNVRYAELHCCTNFSFLEGASHPDELVSQALELDYAALAITDRASLAGVVRAHEAAWDKEEKKYKLKLIIGATVAPVDSAPLVLWATDRAAYGRLASLLTHARRSAPKGEYHLSFADIAAYSDGLLAGVLLRGIRGVNENPQSNGFELQAESESDSAAFWRTRLRAVGRESPPSNAAAFVRMQTGASLRELREYRDV